MMEKTIKIKEKIHEELRLKAFKEKKTLKKKVEEIFEREIAKEKELNNTHTQSKDLVWCDGD